MAWRRRYIRSGSVYEICFRAREGIPLPPSRSVNFLVECALAWALRNDPVKVCHMVVMGNHVHLMVIAYDPQAFITFYGEFMKRLTDSVKRLTGRSQLRLWDSRAMVALVADAEACKNRIAYFYLNPARAGLAESIETYPGVSTWEAFKTCEVKNCKEVVKELPSIKMTDIQEARHQGPGRRIINALKLLSLNRSKLRIRYYPFAWMEIFGMESSDVEGSKQSIIAEVKEEEKKLKTKREKAGKSVVSEETLRKQRPLCPFVPKKYGRRVFILSSILELRSFLIQTVMSLEEKCAALYEKWKKGYYPDDWPLGMFKPSPPMLASLIR